MILQSALGMSGLCMLHFVIRKCYYKNIYRLIALKSNSFLRCPGKESQVYTIHLTQYLVPTIDVTVMEKIISVDYRVDLIYSITNVKAIYYESWKLRPRHIIFIHINDNHSWVLLGYWLRVARHATNDKLIDWGGGVPERLTSWYGKYKIANVQLFWNTVCIYRFLLCAQLLPLFNNMITSKISQSSTVYLIVLHSP